MKINNIVAFTWAVVTLTACNNDEADFVNSNFPHDGVIRVTTQVNTPVTRAGVDDDNLSAFYLDVKNENLAAYSYFVLMKKESDVWNSYEGETPKQMLWQNDKTPIKVTAAYLQDHIFTSAELQGTVDLSVAADQSDTEADAVAANDLVGMAQTTINPTDKNDPNMVDGKIKVTLKHALAKLKVKVTLNTEFSAANSLLNNNPISTLTVNGTKLKYTYTGATADVTLQSTDNDAKAVTPASGSFKSAYISTCAEANYECILVPQQIAEKKFSVRMTIDDKEYVWQSASPVTLAAGTCYTLELTAGKEMLIAKSISASAWGDEIQGDDLETTIAANNKAE